MNALDSLVSVIIPTHNRSSKLKRAVVCVEEQTYTNIEIIVIDDASTDNTSTVVRQLQQSYNNIVYLKNEQNYGNTATHNKCLEKSRGGYLTFLNDEV